MLRRYAASSSSPPLLLHASSVISFIPIATAASRIHPHRSASSISSASVHLPHSYPRGCNATRSTTLLSHGVRRHQYQLPQRSEIDISAKNLNSHQQLHTSALAFNRDRPPLSYVPPPIPSRQQHPADLHHPSHLPPLIASTSSQRRRSFFRRARRLLLIASLTLFIYSLEDILRELLDILSETYDQERTRWIVSDYAKHGLRREYRRVGVEEQQRLDEGEGGGGKKQRKQQQEQEKGVSSSTNDDHLDDDDDDLTSSAQAAAIPKFAFDTPLDPLVTATLRIVHPRFELFGYYPSIFFHNLLHRLLIDPQRKALTHTFEFDKFGEIVPAKNFVTRWTARLRSQALEFLAVQVLRDAHAISEIERQNPTRIGLSALKKSRYDRSEFYLIKALLFAREGNMNIEIQQHLLSKAIECNLKCERWMKVKKMCLKGQKECDSFLKNLEMEFNPTRENENRKNEIEAWKKEKEAKSSPAATSSSTTPSVSTSASSPASTSTDNSTPLPDVSTDPRYLDLRMWVDRQSYTYNLLYAECLQRQKLYPTAIDKYIKTLKNINTLRQDVIDILGGMDQIEVKASEVKEIIHDPIHEYGAVFAQMSHCAMKEMKTVEKKKRAKAKKEKELKSKQEKDDALLDLPMTLDEVTITNQTALTIPSSQPSTSSSTTFSIASPSASTTPSAVAATEQERIHYLATMMLAHDALLSARLATQNGFYLPFVIPDDADEGDEKMQDEEMVEHDSDSSINTDSAQLLPSSTLPLTDNLELASQAAMTKFDSDLKLHLKQSVFVGTLFEAFLWDEDEVEEMMREEEEGHQQQHHRHRPSNTTSTSSQYPPTLMDVAPANSFSPFQLSTLHMIQYQLDAARAYEQLARVLASQGRYEEAKRARFLGKQGTKTQWIKKYAKQMRELMTEEDDEKENDAKK